MFFANNAAAALVKVRLELQGRIVAARVPRVNSDRTVSTTVIVTTVIFTIDHLKKNKKTIVHLLLLPLLPQERSATPSMANANASQVVITIITQHPSIDIIWHL